MRKTRAGWLAALALLCALLCANALAEDNWLDTRLGRTASGQRKRYLAQLCVEGEIAQGDWTYDHLGTLDVLASLTEDAQNAGLILLFNTPGGYLYEGDELYHALMTYKQATGRPVYAYMQAECCSAGVLAAMAADTIMAGRMSVTGSVGVYLRYTSTAGLMQKLGIEQTYVATGANKVEGYPTLTDEQRAIAQASVDEGFAFFKQAIAQARGLSEEQMAAFTDGRILTATQAKALGLIDEVCYLDEALDAFCADAGVMDIVDVTPIWEDTEEKGVSDSDILNWLRDEIGASARRGGLRGL